MKALEFETPAACGKFDNGCNRQHIVGGKLRINDVSHAEQLFGTCEIIEIGHCFACKYGIVGKTALLRTFDLCVPVSTLYKPDHQPPPIPASLLRNVIDYCRGTFLIG